MTVVQAIFPVLRGTRRFFVEKGRRWSVVEHLVLDAVSRTDSSAAALAVSSALPKRIVVEALIRLMRAGWAEIGTAPDGLVFRATALGRVRARDDQLPATTVTEPKWRGFAIEQITGGVFRSRELDIRPQSRLPSSNDDQIVVKLDRSVLPAGDLGEVFAAIEGEDELIVGIDRAPERLIERFAVVTVRENMIEGLPSRASPSLRLQILAKAQDALNTARAQQGAARTSVPVQSVATPLTEEPEPYEQCTLALFDDDDLIIDASAHEEALEKLVRNARERVIIHSTFLNEARAQALLPLFLGAAARGAIVDVLWGQDDVGTSTNGSSLAATKFQAAAASAGRGDSIRVHPFSTNSHAKIAVADNGKGAWHALVGSCNWLATDFKSFETSVRLRDSAMVGKVVMKLGALSCGRPGIWNDLAIEMTVLGRRVTTFSRGKGRMVPMRLLFGADHARLVLEARDRAEKRLFVLSHRIGIAAMSMTLLPALAAAKAGNVTASLYYGRTTGPFSGTDSADLIRKFAKEGIAIRPVHRPRLHAKVLGWDDGALAVSSLNWLSADPSDASPGREIGVLIEATRLADSFLRKFEQRRDP